MIGWAYYPYAGAVVLVTGGGTGIGRSIARAFLEQGASVALVGRSEEALQEASRGFSPGRVLTIAADLTDPSESVRCVAAVIERFGRLDVLIASAGSSEPSPLEDLDDGVWERLRAINLDAFLRTARSAAPHLRATRGNIVAISSIAGLRGDWGMFAYNATKAAVNVAVQGLALDLGADEVRVNAVAPGFTATRLTESRLDDPEFMTRLLDRTALPRVAEPDDIARVVLFVASPDAGYMTGAIIPVDGGVSASSGTPRPLPPSRATPTR